MSRIGRKWTYIDSRWYDDTEEWGYAKKAEKVVSQCGEPLTDKPEETEQ